MSLRVRKAANGTVALTTASLELLAANEQRKYALIVNSSAVAVWLCFGATAVIGTGVYLAAGGGSYEIDETNLFLGAVNGIAASSSGNVIGTVEFS